MGIVQMLRKSSLYAYRLLIWLLLLSQILFWAALPAFGVDGFRFIVRAATFSAFLSVPNCLFDFELLPGLSGAVNRVIHFLLFLFSCATSFWAGVGAAFQEGGG